MKKANRSNALLVELLIVVIFFMLASMVLLQVFTASSNQGRKAGAINEALVLAQNTADRLYAAEPGDDGAVQVLRDLGYKEEEDGAGWKLRNGIYWLVVQLEDETMDAGIMRRATVQAFKGEDTLFTLPVARYEEAQQ